MTASLRALLVAVVCTASLGARTRDDEPVSPVAVDPVAVQIVLARLPGQDLRDQAFGDRRFAGVVLELVQGTGAAVGDELAVGVDRWMVPLPGRIPALIDDEGLFVLVRVDAPGEGIILKRSDREHLLILADALRAYVELPAGEREAGGGPELAAWTARVMSDPDTWFYAGQVLKDISDGWTAAFLSVPVHIDLNDPPVIAALTDVLVDQAAGAVAAEERSVSLDPARNLAHVLRRARSERYDDAVLRLAKHAGRTRAVDFLVPLAERHPDVHALVAQYQRQLYGGLRDAADLTCAELLVVIEERIRLGPRLDPGSGVEELDVSRDDG
jgi:hypothetical protein